MKQKMGNFYQNGNEASRNPLIRNKKFKNLEKKLRDLTFNKVLEIKDLTKQEAEKLFNLYNKIKEYIVRGPIQDSFRTKYSLYFELNPYKKNQKK